MSLILAGSISLYITFKARGSVNYDTHLYSCIFIPAVAATESFPVVDPAFHGEVGRLGHIEAMIEPGMIGVREYNDHVPLLLDHFVNLHTVKKI
jgi:hypothetical protein